MALARLLDDRLRSDSAAPLVTFYDDATGERIELSAATFANWVSKTCGYLAHGHSLEPASELGLWLPVHWQPAVIIAACWRLGVTPIFDRHEIGLAFAHESELAEALDLADDVIGLALAPMAGRLREQPIGVEDYAVEVVGYADVWTGPYPPDVGVDVLDELAGKRVLHTGSEWSPAALAASLITPLATGGSVVLVRNVDPTKLDRKIETERITAIV